MLFAFWVCMPWWIRFPFELSDRVFGTGARSDGATLPKQFNKVSTEFKLKDKTSVNEHVMVYFRCTIAHNEGRALAPRTVDDEMDDLAEELGGTHIG